jgi:hypothetical protein
MPTNGSEGNEAINQFFKTVAVEKRRRVNDCEGSCGAQGRNRTTDTCIFSAVLYRLSYLGTPAARAASL